MKTFNDLVFKVHLIDGIQACLDFENGYGISVISGNCFYSSEEAPYEVAVIKDNSVCYNTPITDDVIGYQTAEQVTEIMKQIQELPKDET